MSYRVCIPTAGTGSRLYEKTKYVNKSLVSIATKTTLSRIIESFPCDAEFIIALGYKGDLVREFISLAYPEKKIFFVDVFPFEGEGSGLGYSLSCCKEYLQQPFVFISCDTIVDENIPAPTENWMGWADREEVSQYRTLEIIDNDVITIHEKGFGDKEKIKPYIGLAGIFDYKLFWEAMEKDSSFQEGESFGLKGLIQNNCTIKSHYFTWHDTGNLKTLEATRKYFSRPTDPTILEKPNEDIWFVDDFVIKYANDKKFIADRIARAKELDGFVPQIISSSLHMYKYKLAEGEVLSRIITPAIFGNFLEHCVDFWKKEKLDIHETILFQETCHSFYYTKTLERVKLFFANFDKNDEETIINGVAIPPIKYLWSKVDWESLKSGISGRFHGDFHFENILYASSEKRFIFLDWRQNFGDNLKFGDIYYDLAKLMHGIIINHELIAQNAFNISWNQKEIKYDFLRRHNLVECQKMFENWLKKQGYDIKKVYLLTALIYLNIAALHHYPYSLLLYALGKEMLHFLVNNNL